MHWRAELDDLRRRVSAQVTPERADARDDARGIADDTRLTGGAIDLPIALPLSVTTHGWRIALSCVATPDRRRAWHMSAALSPRGRSSRAEDWKMLGHFAAHVGAPKEPILVPEDPTRPVHWSWVEDSRTGAQPGSRSSDDR